MILDGISSQIVHSNVLPLCSIRVAQALTCSCSCDTVECGRSVRGCSSCEDKCLFHACGFAKRIDIILKKSKNRVFLD